jgi:hypothetical protein
MTMMRRKSRISEGKRLLGGEFHLLIQLAHGENTDTWASFGTRAHTTILAALEIDSKQLLQIDPGIDHAVMPYLSRLPEPRLMCDLIQAARPAHLMSWVRAPAGVLIAAPLRFPQNESTRATASLRCVFRDCSPSRTSFLQPPTQGIPVGRPATLEVLTGGCLLLRQVNDSQVVHFWCVSFNLHWLHPRHLPPPAPFPFPAPLDAVLLGHPRRAIRAIASRILARYRRMLNSAIDFLPFAISARPHTKRVGSDPR